MEKMEKVLKKNSKKTLKNNKKTNKKKIPKKLKKIIILCDFTIQLMCSKGKIMPR